MLYVSGQNLSSVQGFNHSHGVLPYSMYSCVNFFFISSYDANFVDVNHCLAKSQSVIRKYSCISLKSLPDQVFVYLQNLQNFVMCTGFSFILTIKCSLRKEYSSVS